MHPAGIPARGGCALGAEPALLIKNKNTSFKVFLVHPAGNLTRRLRLLSRKPSGFRELSSPRENYRFLPFQFDSCLLVQKTKTTLR